MSECSRDRSFIAWTHPSWLNRYTVFRTRWPGTCARSPTTRPDDSIRASHFVAVVRPEWVAAAMPSCVSPLRLAGS